MVKTFNFDLAGRQLTVTHGKVAEQANGACLLSYGDTVVLVTATASKQPREGMDFFPLMVDYEERMYSVGKIPGGFIKREGRPSENATLTSRLIDRPIRPLFPDGYRNEVQVICTVLSVDQDHTPDVVAMIGSSIALTISDIPFSGPTGSAIVGLIDGQYIVNPTKEQREKSQLHLVVSGTEEGIMMVEAGSNEISEEVMLEGIMIAHEEIKKICRFINEIKAEVGKEKQDVYLYKVDEAISQEVREYATDKMVDAIQTFDKLERAENMGKVKEEVSEYFIEKYPDNKKDINSILSSITKEQVRKMIIEKGIRPDNRKTDEIRPISCETGLLPRTHGTGLFNRGQTQVLTIATLGALGDIQKLDGVSEEESKRYMHHYNFTPYSVGETRFMRGPGRREIGHGALAERALVPVLPSEDEFPYAIRLVSEVLSSNGSTSQASVCGSSLSLMDAGVPIKKSVAGIAMGLIKSGDKIAVLTDIQGMEDFLGDMDFKVAGTKDGITAIQMDIKIGGINKEILKEALQSAKEGRFYIQGKMDEVISEPRKELSPYAPRMISMSVDPEKIRDIIGPGGKVINRIINETGVKIDINDEGKVLIASVNMEDGQRALSMIEDIVKDVEVGEIYLGKVTKIVAFGAFVEVMNGKEGLVHISKLSNERVNKVEDVVAMGDEILVKVVAIDNQGRINLSRKDALPNEEESEK